MHLLKACSWWDKSEKWRNLIDEVTPGGQKNEKMRNLKNYILINFWLSAGCPSIFLGLFGAQLRKAMTCRAYSCISSRVIRSQVELVARFGADGQIGRNDEHYWKISIFPTFVFTLRPFAHHIYTKCISWKPAADEISLRSEETW